MITKYTIFFIFFMISLLFSYVHSQTPSDSCNSVLTLQTPLPFETASLTCVAILWGSHNFILRYAQASSNVWNYLLSAPNTNAYVGIGFSPDGNMVGSSAVVGWVGSDGTSNVQKYYLGGKSSNLVKIEPPGQGLQVNSSSVVVQSNRIYVAFQLRSDSPSTRLIYAVGPIGRLPVGPNFQLAQHDDMISTALDYTTGQFQSQINPESSLMRSHGLLNMLGWAILMPIGVMIARYMRKWDPIWFYSHATIQSLGFILGLIGIITGLVLENRLSASVNKHKGIGIAILTLGCLQVIAVLVRPNKTSEVRKYWNWYHHGVGRVLILLAVINVFYGIHLANGGSDWNTGFAFVLVVFFVISLILELRRVFKE
ncbi:hypothetical protein CASFOL_039659 [Castilleja foliolosa]|uniref:Cytochrome b561 and DOMON domain-containing protein n=1 Tax=Castilleja foliolosa TaxID=1961234 RepID=A0ABD3BG87_9LAMI